MSIPTLDQILHDARSLPRKERARLVATIVEELAEQPIEAPVPTQTGWARWHAAVADFRATYPNADVSGRLEADRREREASLLGKESDAHV